MTNDLIRQLANEGLPLVSVFDATTLGAALSEDVSGYRQVLVIGSAGRGLWPEIDLNRSDNPVDDYAVETVQRLLQAIGCNDYRIIYPSDISVVDLRALGQMAGWHADSRLGIGINAEYGTWLAYRVVVASNTELPLSELKQSASACNDCSDKPCIAACPAGAVDSDKAFDLDACATERLRKGSDCQDKCIARLACPVGSEHQYSAAQVSYHYGRSLVSLKKYRSNG